MGQDGFEKVLKRLAGFCKKHREILFYVFFGCLTTVVSIGSFVLFHTALGMNELIANVISWILAVGFAFVTNRNWVFCSQAQGAAVWREAVSFYSGRLLTLGIEEGLLLVLVTWLAFPGAAVKIAAQIIVLVGNYAISKWLIFRKK